jgi:VCBS repeat-containing protein
MAAPGVLGNDSDVDSASLTAAVVTGPTRGTLALNANGAFTYTPAANYSGPDSFTYTASDGSLASNVATVAITVTAVNDAPVAGSDSYTTEEDTLLTVPAPGVLGNDSDLDSASLTAAVVTGPANGTLTLNADGSFTYTPAANYNGPDSFTYAASDGSVDSTAATVTITVTPVNDAPVASDQAVTTDEDTVTAITLAATDVEETALTFTIVTAPAQGTLTGTAPALTYTPAANYSGPDSFTFKASDGSLDSNVATVAITVSAVNDAPIAVSDNYTTEEDTLLTVPAPGVLGNDSDVDSASLTAAVVTGPAHGALALNADGSFTYTPAANYSGPDSFTYTASDGSVDSTAATVTITVTPVNDAPVASDQAVTTDEDTVTAITLAATDVDETALTFTIVTAPAHGTLTGTAPTLTYTPAANYSGPDSFTFKATDGTADSNLATVTITVTAVNDAPVAGGDSYTTDEDTALTVAAPGVLGNDSDVDSASLTAAVVTGPANGTVMLKTDGSFTYSPAANYSGPDSFTYRASDGSLDSSVATVAITVTAVNDAPVASDAAVTTDEDTPKAISLTASDAEGAALTFTVIAAPANGTLSGTAPALTYTPAANYSGPDSFTFKASDGTADSNVATVTITVTPVNDAPVAGGDSYTTDEDTALTVAAPGVLGTDSDVDGNPLTAVLVTGVTNGTLALNADGSFTYTPAANYSGPDSFTYTASDGTLDSSVATVAITVTAVNDAPVAAGDSYSTNEDTALTIAAPGVLGTDSDVDGNPLTAVLVTGVANGTLALDADGSVSYTPHANFNGTDSFTYKASDGTADSNIVTVTITVSAVNDAPVAAADSYTTDEDTALTIAAPGVLGNDSDVDSAALTAAVVTGPAHGTLTLAADGSFTYTPTANYNGPDSFTYTATDGSLTSNVATVAIAVTAVNDAPLAAADSYVTDEDTPLALPMPGVLANDSDVDADALTAVIVTGPTYGTLTLNADGAFTYTPTPNYSGPVGFTYTATDGSLVSNIATVTIMVTAVNDAPVAASDSYVTEEDLALTIPVPGVLGNDSDVDADALTAVIVTGPTYGTLTLNADGAFTYTPTANYSGSDSFTYTASDGTLDSNGATVSITVTPVNDAPVAVADAYSTTEDTPLAIAAPGFLGNDSDADSATLTAALVAGPAHGTLSMTADGGFTYVPAANYSGPDSFTYTANDGALDSNVAAVSIAVFAVNDTPVAANDSYATDEDTVLTIAAPGLLANDTDADATVIEPGTVTLAWDASGDPIAGYILHYGTTSGVYDQQVDVGNTIMWTQRGLSPGQQYYFAVSAYSSEGQHGPLSDEVSAIAPAEASITNAALTAALVTGPTHGTLTLNADGSFTYAPFGNYSGTDSFTYRANDGLVDSDAATVTITVADVNDAPIAGDQTVVTEEDTPRAITLTATDAEAAALTYTIVTAPAHGSLSGTAPALIYTPAPNYSGPDSFTFTATDGSLDSNLATVAITVTAVNDAPIAASDNYATSEDTPLTLAAPGVLANDSDVDADALTAVIVTGPTYGLLALDPNGSFTYTPNANVNGTDAFQYQARDTAGALSEVATVTIAVTAVNDAPSFTVGADQSAAKDSGARIVAGWAGNVIAGPSDESLQALTFTVSNDNAALFAVQPAVAPDGTLTFTPATGATGTARVTVQLRDSGGTANGGIDTSAPQTFNVTILGPPSVSIADAGMLEGNAGTTPMVFTVTLSGPTTQPVTVSYQTLNGTASSTKDYQATSGTLTFAAGETSKTITVLVNGDTSRESTETFVVRLSIPINATIADSDGLAFIIDDDS